MLISLVILFLSCISAVHVGLVWSFKTRQGNSSRSNLIKLAYVTSILGITAVYTKSVIWMINFVNLNLFDFNLVEYLKLTEKLSENSGLFNGIMELILMACSVGFVLSCILVATNPKQVNWSFNLSKKEQEKEEKNLLQFVSEQSAIINKEYIVNDEDTLKVIKTILYVNTVIFFAGWVAASILMKLNFKARSAK